MRTAGLIIFILLSLFACEENQIEENKGLTEKRENVVEYYPTGIKKVEGKMLNGKRSGKWIYYYENGFIWSEGHFKAGKQHGYSKVYHENGKVKLEGLYENNVKVGKWKFWNASGDLVETLDFDKEK